MRKPRWTRCCEQGTGYAGPASVASWQLHDTVKWQTEQNALTGAAKSLLPGQGVLIPLTAFSCLVSVSDEETLLFLLEQKSRLVPRSSLRC